MKAGGYLDIDTGGAATGKLGLPDGVEVTAKVG